MFVCLLIATRYDLKDFYIKTMSPDEKRSLFFIRKARNSPTWTWRGSRKLLESMGIPPCMGQPFAPTP